MSVTISGDTGLAGAATGALNGSLGATTPSTIVGTTGSFSGDVGINTAIVAGSPLTIKSKALGAWTSIRMLDGAGGTNYWDIGAVNSSSNVDLLFSMAGSAKMTLDASGNLSTSKSVNAINSATITKVSNFGVETPFTPGASKTFTLGCSNTLIFLIANNSLGASAFGYVSYNSGTVTFMAGSDASFVNSSSPTANQLGIYKSANSGAINFKTGSTYSSGITITVLGGALTVTDPA